MTIVDLHTINQPNVMHLAFVLDLGGGSEILTNHIHASFAAFWVAAMQLESLSLSGKQHLKKVGLPASQPSVHNLPSTSCSVELCIEILLHLVKQAWVWKL